MNASNNSMGIWVDFVSVLLHTMDLNVFQPSGIWRIQCAHVQVPESRLDSTHCFSSAFLADKKNVIENVRYLWWNFISDSRGGLGCERVLLWSWQCTTIHLTMRDLECGVIFSMSLPQIKLTYLLGSTSITKEKYTSTVWLLNSYLHRALLLCWLWKSPADKMGNIISSENDLFLA